MCRWNLIRLLYNIYIFQKLANLQGVVQLVDKEALVNLANQRPNIATTLDNSILEEFFVREGFVESLKPETLEKLSMSEDFVGKLREIDPGKIAKVASMPNILARLSDEALKVSTN